MTKDQVSAIAEGLKVRLGDDSNGALESIKSILSGDLSVQSEARQGILQVVCSDNLMDLFKQQFCALYISCNSGLKKDRYALFQIQFQEWMTQCLICGTPENVDSIPDSISLRNDKENESSDTSAVLHAFCVAFFEIMSHYIEEMRPQSPQSPVICSKKMDKMDDILGFAGACMRIIFKKTNDPTRLLIRNLQMTKEMKAAYLTFGVLSSGASQQPTVPVRALNMYLMLLNRSMRECCREELLLLYKQRFVKVSVTANIHHNMGTHRNEELSLKLNIFINKVN